MENAIKICRSIRVPTIENVTNAILWPGEKVCDWLKIQDEESRILFRMFINLTFYTKIGTIIALLLFYNQ